MMSAKVRADVMGEQSRMDAVWTNERGGTVINYKKDISFVRKNILAAHRKQVRGGGRSLSPSARRDSSTQHSKQSGKDPE